MRIESNRKVPQTNRLSLGVLDMDAHWNSLLTPCLEYFLEFCIVNSMLRLDLHTQCVLILP